MSTRRGIVLPTALVLLVGGTLLAHALWWIVELEVEVTAVEARRLEKRAGAIALLHSAVRDPSVAPPSGVEVDSVGPVLRLFRAGSEHGRFGVLALTPTPASIASEIGAPVRVGEAGWFEIFGRVEPLERSECAPAGAAARGQWSGVGVLVAGKSIEAWADTFDPIAGSIEATPDSLSPRVEVVPGSAWIRGAGRVVVIADRIRVAANARISGFLVGREWIVVEAGAEVRGALHTAGHLTVGPGARIVPAPCAAAYAVLETEIGQPRRIGPVGWPVR